MTRPSRIALIDDDRAWRETLADFLTGKGFEVSTAEGGRQGLALLERTGIRLAVIDFHMPDLDGLEVLRRLRPRQRNVTALLLSSDDDPTLPARARAEGAKAFLPKTTAPRTLLRRLLEELTEPRIWLPAPLPWKVRLPVPRDN